MSITLSPEVVKYICFITIPSNLLLVVAWWFEVKYWTPILILLTVLSVMGLYYFCSKYDL